MKSMQVTIDTVVKEPNPTWANTIQKLDEESAKLDFATNAISHINNVRNVEDVRVAFEAILPKLSNFSTDLSQNKDLYKLFQNLKASKEFDSYCDAQKTIINHAIRDFKASGIDLDDAKKARLKEINARASELSNNFAKNVIDSTQAWTFYVTEETKDKLKGLPEHTIILAAEKAKKDGKNGWVLTLDAPCYEAVMSYAEDRDLRAAFYKAKVTVASNEADAKQFDNSAIIDDVMKLSHEKARILGYKNYAEYSLIPKMAGSTEEVMQFLNDLARRSKPQGERELTKLKDFAKEHDGIADFSPWDTVYYATLYKKTHFDFSEEDLRPYFPEEKVFKGLFALARRIFGLKVEEVACGNYCSLSTKFFEVRDKDGNLRGKFYADLFARDFKNSGAWVSGLRSRMKKADGSIQTPVG
ncbi:MAG: M3 family metallopeptidase, partial [Pseudomonadota bacterium]